jgi:hypothetical protein
MVACAATLALLSVLPAATAKADRGILDNSILAGFTLGGSNGYRIQVLTLGRQLAILGASKGQVGASYAVQGKISGNRIEARFGSLGHISVRFVPSSHPQDKESQRQRCDVPIDLSEKGTFRGTIRFAGEHGYTRVSSHRAPGAVIGIGIGQEGCGTAESAAPSEALPLSGLTTRLTAIAKKNGKTYSLDASRVGDDGQLSLNASVEERRPRMEIFRVASAVVGGENSFLSTAVGSHPAQATLKPPKPFSGIGVFQENSSLSASWLGSIAAWFPGIGKVRLAGPKFASSYCRQPEQGSGCSLFPTVQRDFRTAQDSGSQSQAFREVMLSWSKYLLNSASSDGSTP